MSSGSKLRLILERFLFLLARWFLFPAALTPIRACHRGDSSNLINTITVEEELEAAQSKASNKALSFFRLDSGRASRSRVIELFP